MADIFLSYSREDQRYAEALADLLQRRGLTVWWDVELMPAQKLRDRIVEEINAAQATVVLWSSAARDSEFVKNEAELALKAKKLIQASLDGEVPPIGFSNSRIQFSDLSYWIPGMTAKHIPSLFESIEKFVSPGSNIEILTARTDELERDQVLTYKKLWLTRVSGLLILFLLLGGLSYIAFNPNVPENLGIFDPTALSEKLSGNNTAIQKIDQDLKTVQSKVTDTTTKLAKSQEDLQKLTSEQTQLKAQLKETATQHNALEQRLEQIQTSLTENNSEMQHLQEKLDKLNGATPPPLTTDTIHRDSLTSGELGPEIVAIKGGKFMMGSPETEKGRGSNEHQHPVTVSDFYIGKYEVTFADYDRYAKAMDKPLPEDEGWGRENRPVINVSWDDAVAYTKWLSEKTGENYRLPTEAEWEYAARGREITAYWWGQEYSSKYANCSGEKGNDRWKYSSPVGSFPENPFGLHDMHGNVREWVHDRYSEDYSNASSGDSTTPSVNPSGPESGSRRVARGGDWSGDAEDCRSAYRRGRHPGGRRIILGFRVGRTSP